MSKVTKRSLFRYYGGKWRLASWINKFFPHHRTYVEPFCGAASVFFKKERSYSECLNDVNGEIVTLFKVLQKDICRKALIKRLLATPYSRAEYDKAHDYSQHQSDIETSRRFIIRSLMGYHSDSVVKGNCKSGFRNDLDRKYTIPSHQWVSYPECLDDFAERLKGVVIENSDAFYLLNKWKNKDYLWYLDPPYVHSTRTDANKHSYLQEMTDADHENLLEVIQGLKGSVVLSGYDSKIYQQLESNGWKKESKVYRNNTFQSGERIECIWLNPKCQQELNKPEFVFDFS
jgi:DNA adenine methylase